MTTAAECALRGRGLCCCRAACRYDELTPERRRAIYEALLPGLRLVAWQAGYSLGVHGTMRRDLDLIAAPWIEHAAPAEVLIEQLAGEAHASAVGPPSVKPHGRRAWSLHLTRHWHLYLDVSVLPRSP